MEMTLDRYINEILPSWEYVILANSPSDEYNDRVIWPWFRNIAPVKAKLYGMEGWQRLGARGLVVELTGCYYRWKHLMEVKSDSEYWEAPYIDCLRDAFGYAVMTGIIKYGTPDEAQPHEALIRHVNGMKAADYNERLIFEVWEGGIESMVFWDAIRMAYAMFKEG
jgi:hypothetical protein